MTENWERCPSTHCERAQECRSPNECAGSGVSSNQTVWACGRQCDAHMWDYRFHLLGRMDAVLKANGLRALSER